LFHIRSGSFRQSVKKLKVQKPETLNCLYLCRLKTTKKMLQVSYIRENRAKVLERLAVRNFRQPELVDRIIQLDEDRRKTQSQLDSISAEANAAAKQIGDLMRQGKKEEAEAVKASAASFKDQTRVLGEQLSSLEAQLQAEIVLLPNLPHESVPAGSSPEENVVALEHGNKPVLPENALPHWELAAKYDIIDFELGVKITGAGFPVYKGKGARLQRALINFFLDNAQEAGYREMQVPIVVNEASGFGTGQLPDKEGQMYHVGIDNLYLIPTAEVPVTNLYRDEIVKEEELPIRNCGYTPCFRREAGSYGAHVRGLNRLHQFDKVEIVQIAHPQSSYTVLEEMSTYVQSLLQKLELPYRVLSLCGGDMGFTSAKTYDMEVWCAAQARWLEVSSVSNFETYQSNRLKLRFKGKEGKPQLAHTLNGSALALPRIVASLLENNQTEKGIRIPAALVPYTGFEYID
jgi:seryl-tRNA synthetase